MGLILWLPKKYSTLDHAKRKEFAGRKKGKPVGTHVTDLAELKKSIALCRGCRSGFSKKKYDYMQSRVIPVVRGACDACKSYSPAMELLVHRSMGFRTL